MAAAQLLILFSLLCAYAYAQSTCNEEIIVDGSHTVAYYKAGGYEPFLNCKYTYTSKSGRPLKVTAAKFDLEGIMGCRYDFVKLYDGSSDSDRMIGVFCGTNGPKNVRTTGNKLSMLFKTDELTHLTGFELVISESCVGDYLCPKSASSDADRCYNKDDACNGQNDCDDGSDEAFCDGQCGNFLPGGLAAGNTFPAAVAITQSSGFIHCGGVLLNEKFILTSAHCFHRLTDKPYRFVAKVGNANLAQADTYQIEKIINHPNFNQLTLQTNIALIKLRDPVARSANTLPICHSEASTVPQNCQTFGWGRTAATNINSYAPSMKVLATTSAACSISSGSPVINDNTKTCARFNAGALCYGDNGGPLVCKNANNKYEVYGINTLSIACTSAARPPALFNKVDGAIYSWVQSTMDSA